MEIHHRPYYSVPAVAAADAAADVDDDDVDVVVVVVVVVEKKDGMMSEACLVDEDNDAVLRYHYPQHQQSEHLAEELPMTMMTTNPMLAGIESKAAEEAGRYGDEGEDDEKQKRRKKRKKNRKEEVEEEEQEQEEEEMRKRMWMLMTL